MTIRSMNLRSSLPEYAYQNLYQKTCFVVMFNEHKVYFPTQCSENSCSTFFCEINVKQKSVQQPVFHKKDNSFLQVVKHTQLLTICPNEEIVHGFLSCDPQSHCLRKAKLNYCQLYIGSNTVDLPELRGQNSSGRLVTVEMYECHTTAEYIPYTLVCDFRKDCRDGSDESFCSFKKGNVAFRCFSGQDISNDVKCDVKDDCLDGSDETECYNNLVFNQYHLYRKPLPVIIDMDGKGGFTSKTMDGFPCPDTHFSCIGKDIYCIPVYLRCNGVKDCPYGEDEVSCDDVTCPGYYRCRSSSVCLHVSHVCDGWPQCPERDDELLCNATCPLACHCQGLAFVCHQLFPASRYPDLRYLDATGSGMIPSNVIDNFYLIYLNLASCGLTHWPGFEFSNLQRLDLTNNSILEFYVNHIYVLPKLKMLTLRKNPLTALYEQQTNLSQLCLNSVDLSHSFIEEFDSILFCKLRSINFINISYSNLHKISKVGFSQLPYLTVLDVRGCPISDFPIDIFMGLYQLNTIHSDNYRLCCQHILPESFNPEKCYSLPHEFSSCEQLLKSITHRIVLWGSGLLCICVNVLSFLYNTFINQRHDILILPVLMFFLNLADALMGVCLVIISSADEVFRDNYIWNEKQWTSSATCKLAGMMYLLSSEVSVFLISIITLQFLILIHFPVIKLQINGRKAILVSVLAWTVGGVLALVPFVSNSTFWSVTGQSGVCFPVPMTEPNINYAGILTICNCVLSVLSAAVHIINLAIMTLFKSADESQSVTIVSLLVRSSGFVLITYLYWVVFSLFYLMELTTQHVSHTFFTFVIVIVQPVISILRPLLYANQTRQENLNIQRKKRITKLLQSI